MNHLVPFAVVFVAALVANLIFIPAILRAAHCNGWFDRIDHRKVHNAPIPAMGGIGIFAAFALSGLVVYLVFFHASEARSFSSWYYGAILLGATIMHITGVADDFIDIPALFKLLFQICAALVAVLGGAFIHRVALPGLATPVSLGFTGVPLTVLWIVGIANAVNLVDGIDGFSGGIGLFAAAALGVLALAGGDHLTGLIAFSLAGAVAGFLVFNLPPARIFMGDGGSLFLGYAIAVVSLMGFAGRDVVFQPVAPLLLVAVPVLDTLTAIIRRTRRGLPIHTPDRGHFHHLLLASSGSGRAALLRAYPLFALLAGAAVVHALVGGMVGTVAVAVALLILVGSFEVLYRRTARFSPEARTPHPAPPNAPGAPQSPAPGVSVGVRANGNGSQHPDKTPRRTHRSA